MRLATIVHRGEVRLVSPLGDHSESLVDLGMADRLRRGAGDLPESISGLLMAGAAALDAARAAVEYVQVADRDQLNMPDVFVNPDDVTFLPIVPQPSKFLCVGQNYKEHVDEGSSSLPKVPVLFVRFPSSLVGHRQPIIRPRLSTELDWEGELAVVIGRQCRHVEREQALDVVAGYTIFNDGSVRDYQSRGVQWTAGKNFWRTGPFGPWLVTAEEVPDPQSLGLRTVVNGEEVQHASTSQMIFDVRTLITYVTEWQRLEPGDVIATGTPAGVGYFREPQRFLKPGDRVTVEIERLGRLENPVIDEAEQLE